MSKQKPQTTTPQAETSETTKKPTSVLMTLANLRAKTLVMDDLFVQPKSFAKDFVGEAFILSNAKLQSGIADSYIELNLKHANGDARVDIAATEGNLRLVVFFEQNEGTVIENCTILKQGRSNYYIAPYRTATATATE